MGNQKHEWTADEEEALLASIKKHGHGKWKNILKDPEFARFLDRGIIALLDEACMFPTSTHETFSQKLYQTFKNNRRFIKPKLSQSDFTIVHHAGEVAEKAVEMESQVVEKVVVNESPYVKESTNHCKNTESIHAIKESSSPLQDSEKIDPQTRFPIPNKRELRLSRGYTSSDPTGSRRIKFHPDPINVASASRSAMERITMCYNVIALNTEAERNPEGKRQSG